MDLVYLIRHPEKGRRLKQIIQILMHYRLGNWLKDIPFQALRDLMVDPKTKALREKPFPERLRPSTSLLFIGLCAAAVC